MYFGDNADAAEELLRNTLVSIWGALEVLINDVLIVTLNKFPPLAVALLNQAPSKRHFQGRAPTMETLIDRGFDLSDAMGDVLISDRPLTSLESMRDVISVIASEKTALHNSLNEKELWLLWQRRHIIVHRRGLVDRIYFERTDDRKQKIGQPLKVSTGDVKAAFRAVQGVGLEVFYALPFDIIRD